MRMKCILGLVLFLSSISVMADIVTPTDTVLLQGHVRDAFNKEYMAGVRVELLSATDERVILAVDSCRDYSLEYVEHLRNSFRQHHNPAEWMYYTFRIVPGYYQLRFSRAGYDNLLIPLKVPMKKNGRFVKNWQVEDAMMKKTVVQELGEAVVTGTKIMMVNQGWHRAICWINWCQ